jgi:DNA repair protein RecN (Recombination protein N)
VQAQLGAAGCELEQGELLVEREIHSSGKSRTFLNGRLATLGTLRVLAPALGDIHGQHEQQDLFSPLTQIQMLDQSCGTTELRERLGEVFAAWSENSARLEQLRKNEQEKLRLLDLWKFQHKEIAQAALSTGEDQRLAEEHRVLANLARILEAGGAAYEALYESPASSSAQLKAASRALEELSRFDPAFGAWAQSLQTVRISLEEVARDMRRHLDRLEANPQRLGQIEDRLALIEKLKRKYGSSIEEIRAFGEQVAAQIAEMESSGETIERLEHERQRLAADYQTQAETLSQRRREGARRLEKPVEKELAALAMERTRFQVGFETLSSWTAQGVDGVEFLVSPNPGETPRPLRLVASGGELSRITLALKTCLRHPRRNPPTTLVFDEIDAGIGGRAADAVGRRLRQLAAHYQLLCVTHLPQIAGFADHHYYVDKQVQGGRTLASITELGPDDRVQELARMLSGAQVTADALRHAQQLLRAGRSGAH